MGENPSYQSYTTKEPIPHCSSQPRRCVVRQYPRNPGTDSQPTSPNDATPYVSMMLFSARLT